MILTYSVAKNTYQGYPSCVRNDSALSEILCLITRYSLIGIISVKKKIESGYRNGGGAVAHTGGWITTEPRFPEEY